jgi:hypothetical protein
MVLCGLLALPSQAQDSSSAADNSLTKHMEELEQEIRELQAEVAALKRKESAESIAEASSGSQRPQAASASPIAPAAAQNSLVTTAAPAAATALPQGPSLGSLLGNTTLSGFVDAYYGQNFNNPAGQANGLRSFDGATNQFGLNLVELVVDKTPDPSNSRTGYHIALGFGQAMNAVNATEPKAGLAFDQYLKEAYFSYLAPVGKGLQIDVGKFVTPAGAEVIETKDDWNYSRSLLFTYAVPYFHFGMRAKYAFNDKYSLSGFFVNGWNNVIDNNVGKTYGMSFGWNPNKKFGITETYLAGPEQNTISSNWRQLTDTVITYSPNSRISFMLNGDYGRGDRYLVNSQTNLFSPPVFWTGVAGYVKYNFNSSSAIATRYEHYDDRDGFTLGTLTPTHVNEFTATLERLVAHHIISRLEFRRDIANQPLFLKGSNPVLDQNTLTAGMVFMFDSREAK